jgi:hypothetical protein
MEEYIAVLMPSHEENAISQWTKLPDFAIQVFQIGFSHRGTVLAQYFNIIIDFIGFDAAILVFPSAQLLQIIQNRLLAAPVPVKIDFVHRECSLLSAFYPQKKIYGFLYFHYTQKDCPVNNF